MFVNFCPELTCEKHNNPADFYLDKIIRSEEQVKGAENATTEEGKGVCCNAPRYRNFLCHMS